MNKKIKVLTLVLLATALLIVTANPTIASVKAQGTAAITVLPSAGGATTPAGSLTTPYTYTIGDVANFTANPSTGYQFLCWVFATAAGANTSTSNPLAYNVTAIGEVQAMFIPTTNATETPIGSGTSSIYVVPSVGGETTPASGTTPSYTIGNVTTFTATPGPGLKFLCWVITPASGGTIYTSNPLAYNVTNTGCAIEAIFLPTSSTVSLPSTVSEFSSASTIVIAVVLLVVASGTYAYNKRTKK